MAERVLVATLAKVDRAKDRPYLRRLRGFE